MRKNLISILSKLIFFTMIVVIQYLATAKISIKVDVLSWDKSNHLLAFLALFVALSFAYLSLGVLSKSIILFLYGLQIEIVQYFLPYRDFSLLDLFADCLGIGLGILFYKLMIKYFGKFLLS